MTFATETNVKAVRKRHRCDGCGKRIEIGSPAVRWAGMTDGDFGAAIYHPDCRLAEIKLNDLLETQWGDEWAALSEIDEEDWPWLIETFPAVAARMGIKPPPAEASLSGAQRSELLPASPKATASNLGCRRSAASSTPPARKEPEAESRWRT